MPIRKLRKLLYWNFSGSLRFILSRFVLVRHLYSFFMAIVQRSGFGKALLSEPDSSCALAKPSDEILKQLRQISYADALALTPDILSELQQRIVGARLVGSAAEGRFEYAAAKDFVARHRVVMAHVDGAEGWQVVGSIVRNPHLLEIASKYLGFAPQHADSRLMVSFSSAEDNSFRQSKNQTVEYHFDVHALSSIYVNFYLSDVDEESGPHMLIPGTHGRKPLRFLFSSVNRSLDEIKNWRPASEERVILGPAGFGFFEDANCYHKALPPLSKERWMLQIRYW